MAFGPSFSRAAYMYPVLNRCAETLAKALALAGGILLMGLTALTCLSIIGRVFVPLDIGIGPVRGIYDMTEIAMAAAIFAFLPWAQLRETHARVDLFQWALPRKADQALDLAFNAAMAFAAAAGGWQLYLGLQDKLRYGETTLIAQIPVWQGYAAAVAGASSFSLVALFCVLRAARRLAGFED